MGGPKDLFYFYFPFEEDYGDITFILPLNRHSAYISKDTFYKKIQLRRYFVNLGCSPVVFTEEELHRNKRQINHQTHRQIESKREWCQVLD